MEKGLSPLLERKFFLSKSLPLLSIINLSERLEIMLRVREILVFVFCFTVSVLSVRPPTPAFSPSSQTMNSWLLSLGCGGFCSSASLAFNFASRLLGVDGGFSSGFSRFR
ncbi:hypothetical protein N665_0275s0041 [Sinapis alba]|nr:hypothetical protein N665_0275s0041 [Sinapis alba]